MGNVRVFVRAVLCTATAAATVLIPGHAGAAGGLPYVCTSGATITVKGSTATIIGEGSCVDNAGGIIPLTFSGSGGGASIPLCLPEAPLVEFPSLSVEVTLSFDGGFITQTNHQVWTALLAPLGSPVYAASISGQGSGLVAGLSLSGTSCTHPLSVQGPFVIVMNDPPPPAPHHPS